MRGTSLKTMMCPQTSRTLGGLDATNRRRPGLHSRALSAGKRQDSCLQHLEQEAVSGVGIGNRGNEIVLMFSSEPLLFIRSSDPIARILVKINRQPEAKT